MASHGDVAWHEAQSRDLREEADVDVEAVIAGLEQDRAAPVGEMRALLFLESAVDHRLCARLVRIDDQDVRPQVGIAASADRRRVRKRAESDRRHACDQFPTCRIAHPALPTFRCRIDSLVLSAWHARTSGETSLSSCS
ncbi:hypothetical protein [uncultured Sphingomonas sp.]|uniref:hypothetical protein n=1 Tax=uncultured Sphingomonas sp. TaxID=158754 RepID=UPI0025DC8919|nr:hypothetical protein [uncultured Sphingomonas sp.]